MTDIGDSKRTAIVKVVADRGHLSVRDIAAEVGLSGTATWQHLKVLEGAGQVRRGVCPTCGAKRWEVVA